MPTITLLTCEKRPELTPSDALLAAALQARGASVRVQPWSLFVPTDEALAVVRSTWDYYERAADFRAWLDRMDAAAAPLLNPIATLRWNLDKAYLRELAAAGAPLPRTHWLADPDPTAIADLLAAEQWDAAVVKPRISAAAHGTLRVSPTQLPDLPALEVAREAGAMVQEYLPDVTGAGEISLLFFDGTYSHAVRKAPRTGDYRVQPEHGGSVTPYEADAALRATADAVLAACPGAPVYARVDLIPTQAGPRLMEVELIEPDLFLDHDAGAAGRFADALLRRVAA